MCNDRNASDDPIPSLCSIDGDINSITHLNTGVPWIASENLYLEAVGTHLFLLDIPNAKIYNYKSDASLEASVNPAVYDMKANAYCSGDLQFPNFTPNRQTVMATEDYLMIAYSDYSTDCYGDGSNMAQSNSFVRSIKASTNEVKNIREAMGMNGGNEPFYAYFVKQVTKNKVLINIGSNDMMNSLFGSQQDPETGMYSVLPDALMIGYFESNGNATYDMLNQDNGYARSYNAGSLRTTTIFDNGLGKGLELYIPAHDAGTDKTTTYAINGMDLTQRIVQNRGQVANRIEEVTSIGTDLYLRGSNTQDPDVEEYDIWRNPKGKALTGSGSENNTVIISGVFPGDYLNSMSSSGTMLYYTKAHYLPPTTNTFDLYKYDTVTGTNTLLKADISASFGLQEYISF